MPKIKLASQRLQVPEASGLLRPSMLSGRAAGQISYGVNLSAPRIAAPQINTGARQVQYTPVNPPRIQNDELTTALIRGGEFSNTLVRSAFDYSRRHDAVFADFQSLEFDEELRDLYYGTIDENGNVVGGYGNTTKLDATQGYGAFQEEVKRRAAQRLENMTPQQRMFALNQLHQSSNAYLVKGATHASSELASAQKYNKDRAYNAATEQMFTDLAAGNPVNMAGIEKALSLIDNADELKTRTNDLVKAALGFLVNTGRYEEAQRLAGEFNNNPRINASTAVLEFTKSVISTNREQENHAMALENFRYSQLTRARSEADRKGKDFLADNAMSLRDGTLATVLGKASTLFSSSAVYQDAAQTWLSDTIKQEWQNARNANDASHSTTNLAEDLRAQLPDLPGYLQDDVGRLVDELELEDDELHLKEIKLGNDIRSQKEASGVRRVTDQLTDLQLNAKSMSQEAINDEIARLQELPDYGKDPVHAAKLAMIADPNSFNPYESKEIAGYYANIADYIDGVKRVEDLAIGNTEMSRIVKELDGLRKSDAGTYMKSALKELAQNYKLIDDNLLGFRFTGNFENDNVTEEQALAEFNRVAALFNGIVTDNLYRGKMAPAAAVQAAMNTIYADPSVTRKMVRKPQTGGNDATKSAESKRNTYEDDHASVLAEYSIPPLKGLEKGGPTNLVDFVKTINAKEARKGEQGRDPYQVMLERHRETLEYLQQLASSAQTTGELVKVMQYMTNHLRQFDYVKNLQPVSQSKTTGTDTMTGMNDADTIYTEDTGAVRNTSLTAAENSTPEGKEQTDKMRRAYEALAKSGAISLSFEPGTGLYERSLGAAKLGPVDFEAVAREIDPSIGYYPGTEPQVQEEKQ